MVAVQQCFSPHERILTAARRLFALQGFHQTPVSELATAADVSVGQIYRLFKDKNDVILAIVSEDIEIRAADLEALSKQAREGSIPIKEAFLQLALLSINKTEESLSCEILAEAHRSTEVAERIAEFCNQYRLMIRELSTIANPELSEQSRRGAEEVLLGLMFGLGHRALSGPCLSVREAAEQTARMIMAALTSEIGN
ncbi:MAG: TetR/AcrR family transcriptional regulator [Sphingomonadales bacterium]|nr:TetR/AcrR family transcriptional regulator [Sphingomonadales bacterium]